jgi:predicted MPP superfamily phosphohydrolase
VSSQRSLSNPKKKTRRSALRLLGLGAASGLWAGGIEPALLSITHRTLSLPHWPRALDGFRLALITDLHYRPGPDDDLIEKLGPVLADTRPDLIALTGDLVTANQSSLSECLRVLRHLDAPHGIFASPGNHDRWQCSPSKIKKEIEGAGMSYLCNANTTLSIKGETIFLNGLDSYWGGHPDPGRAWKGHHRDTPVISLVHEPDPFESLHQAHPLDLQLSGHTHGGQCRVPLIGYAPARVKYGRNFLYGEYQRSRSRLFVGRGIGTVGPRVRFACPPELALLTLRSS